KTMMDIEKQATGGSFAVNTAVQSIAWRGVTMTVKGGKTKGEKRKIVDNVDGVVEAGELCALMGPSGAGKTSLLNFLARRRSLTGKTTGEVLVNGKTLADDEFRRISAFVQQEDHLLGSLTCFETVDFNVRLSTARQSKAERRDFVNDILRSFGLQDKANSHIDLPYRGRISGGQKRRVSVASQVASEPKILFLDEPTTGLDSTGSREVIQYLSKLAKRARLIIICSIHQPSDAVFNSFDKLLLLSEAKTCFFGPPTDVIGYFEAMGHYMEAGDTPADFIVSKVNSTFHTDTSSSSSSSSSSSPLQLHQLWMESDGEKDLQKAIAVTELSAERGLRTEDLPRQGPCQARRIAVLIHRGFVKSNRDPTVYGLRLLLYIILAIIMGTLWSRLNGNQEAAQNVLGIAFGSVVIGAFLAASYIPSLEEDIKHHLQEKYNGYCAPGELLVSNFLTGLPYLVIISVTMSLILYGLLGLKQSAESVLMWMMWMLVVLETADSYSIFCTALVPKANASTAIVLLWNGIQIASCGFLVKPVLMNGFYNNALYQWNYMAFSIRGLLTTQLRDSIYDCGPGCHCLYQPTAENACQVSGSQILRETGFENGSFGKNLGIALAVGIGLRVLAWAALVRRR
ncbi:hypothetical protein CP532_0471, partial [Ophiocordyceps camponoti-leonardi (nom. inval.)]